jgi:hypothetical protein
MDRYRQHWRILAAQPVIAWPSSRWHIRRCLSVEDLLLSDVHSAQLDPDADLGLDVTGSSP